MQEQNLLNKSYCESYLEGNNVSGKHMLKDDKFLFPNLLRVSASKGGSNVTGPEDSPILNGGGKGRQEGSSNWRTQVSERLGNSSPADFKGQ